MVITVDTSCFNVSGYGAFHLKLLLRLMVLDATGVLADWRVHCEVFTLLNESNAFYSPDPVLAQRLSLTTYHEAIRELSVLLQRLYMVLYDRAAVLNALCLALSLEHTTHIGLNMHVHGKALQNTGTCWCPSPRQLVNLDKF